jgi:hypothetical protein
MEKQIPDSFYSDLERITGIQITFPKSYIRKEHCLLHLKEALSIEKRINDVKTNPKRWMNPPETLKGFQRDFNYHKKQLFFHLKDCKNTYESHIEFQKKNFFDMFFWPILKYIKSEIQIQIRVKCKNDGRWKDLEACNQCKHFKKFDFTENRVYCVSEKWKETRRKTISEKQNRRSKKRKEKKTK